MNKQQRQEFTAWLGKRSYKARLKRFGLERLQEIARENGRKGGRPKRALPEGRQEQRKQELKTEREA